MRLGSADFAELAKHWAPVIREYVESEISPLRERLAYLEGALAAQQNRSPAASGKQASGEDGAE